MEGVSISPQAIEAANRRLSELIDSIHAGPGSLSITAERMSAVLAEVIRVGEWARTVSESAISPAQGTLATAAQNVDTLLQTQLKQYRRLLEQLHSLLPDFHTRLLTERLRLQTERVHLDSANAWARSASQSG